jgi:hypothetical protein
MLRHDAYTIPKKQDGDTLLTVLNHISHVDNVYFDSSNAKVLLSVNVNTYDQVFKEAISILKQTKFQNFELTVKKPFLSSGTGSVSSKYLDILKRHRPNNRSPTASIATSNGDNNTRAINKIYRTQNPVSNQPHWCSPIP